MSADSSPFSCRIESVHSSQSDKEADLRLGVGSEEAVLKKQRSEDIVGS